MDKNFSIQLQIAICHSKTYYLVKRKPITLEVFDRQIGAPNFLVAKTSYHERKKNIIKQKLQILKTIVI